MSTESDDVVPAGEDRGETPQERRARDYRLNPELRKWHELSVEWGQRKGGIAQEVMHRTYGSLWGREHQTWCEVAEELGVPEETVRAIWRESVEAVASAYRETQEYREVRAMREAYEQGKSATELVGGGYDREVVEGKFRRWSAGSCQSC